MADLVIRPDKGRARTLVPIKASFGKYFTEGGFTVSNDQVTVRTRLGRTHSCASADVRTIALTSTPARTPDLRLLLCDAEGAVLVQDQSIFYSDADILKLAQALRCSVSQERFKNFAALDDHHPGVLKYRWERRPIKAGIAFVALYFIALVVVLSALTATGVIHAP